MNGQDKPKISFLKYRNIAFILSFLFIVGGFVVAFGVRGGFTLGIDFAGGYSATVDFYSPKVTVDYLRTKLGTGFEVLPIEGKFIEEDDYLVHNLCTTASDSTASQDENKKTIRENAFQLREGTRFQIKFKRKEGDSTSTESVSEVLKKNVYAPLCADLDLDANQRDNFRQIQFSSSEPVIGRAMQQSALQVVLLIVVLILIYIAIRFDLKYSVGAVVALIHDTLGIMAFVGYCNFELNTQIVIAILTTIGYSLNDTIVIFDRIRENTNKISFDQSEFGLVIDDSIWQSLSRTLITSGTTLIAVVAILIFGGEATFNLAMGILVGVTIGTYSSIFIASPCLILWDRYVGNRHKAKLPAKPNKKAAIVNE